MSQQPATRIDLVPGSVLPSVGNELRDLAGHPPHRRSGLPADDDTGHRPCTMPRARDGRTRS